MMIVVIDNYDSFTYNLVQYLGELGAKLRVFRNDKVTLPEIDDLQPEGIVVSPGPCTPKEAGISKDVIHRFSGKVPVLGVCLGHQCLGEVFGGKVVRARRLMHGKTSMIYHDKSGIFRDIPTPFEATRYHSLLVSRSGLPAILRVTARTDQEEIMGLSHAEHRTWGVQFHPESILTVEGKRILKNFLDFT
jgi:anthranilate synthase/aminodeoxychorismate synthase-like glutamine amidotransferase